MLAMKKLGFAFSIVVACLQTASFAARATCDVLVVGGGSAGIVDGVVFERCKFASLRPSLLRGNAVRSLRNVTFRSCERKHLDRISVRHHPGFGEARSRKFIEVEGEVDGLSVVDCSPVK